MRDEIRIGLDAWGSIGRTHVLGLRSLPVLFPDLPFRPVLAGVATRRAAANREWILASGFESVCESVSALIPDVDCLDICTPNALHAETAIAAWRAGKAVYCEKPLSHGFDEARRMASVYTESAVVSPRAAASQVAFTLRFWPAVARAKDLLEAGRLGRILAFRGRMVHGGYLDPKRAFSWRMDKALAGGGALADLGIHLIDLVHFLLGPLSSVESRMRTFVAARPLPGGGTANVEVDDWAELTVSLAGGAVGTIEATRAGDGQEETALELFGTEGSLRISNLVSQAYPQWFDRAGGVLHSREVVQAGPYEKALLEVLPPARLSLGSFVDTHAASLHWWLRRVLDPAWERGRPPLAAGIADALAAQEIMAVAYAGARWQ